MPSSTPPLPAYNPTPNCPSPFRGNPTLYAKIASAPRTLLHTLTLPPRSGQAFHAPRASLVRISTPLGPQVGDLNIWSAANPRERFWAARTRQLHAAHVSTLDRLWSALPFLRPLATIVADTVGGRASDGGYGTDRWGGRCHDLLGTRCDPYVDVLIRGGQKGGQEQEVEGYDFCCHSNLVRAVAGFGLGEGDVHDVLNVFQVTGLDAEGRYFMEASPAKKGDYIEFFAEMDLLMALSTCHGGDLSTWGWGEGEGSKERMCEVCRPLKVEIFKLVDEESVLEGWEEPKCPPYKGRHGMKVPLGERLSS